MTTPISLADVHASVVRIPVAGPSPNNTLVFVRGTVFPEATQYFPPEERLTRAIVTTASVYQIAGFDQTKAQSYIDNTKFSVTAFSTLLESDDDSSFVAAIDSIEGNISSDGTFFITAKYAYLISDADLYIGFNFVAYILTEEPAFDFTRPPNPFHQSVTDRYVPGVFVTARKPNPIKRVEADRLFAEFERWRKLQQRCSE